MPWLRPKLFVTVAVVVIGAACLTTFQNCSPDKLFNAQILTAKSSQASADSKAFIERGTCGADDDAIRAKIVVNGPQSAYLAMEACTTITPIMLSYNHWGIDAHNPNLLIYAGRAFVSDEN